MRRLRRVIHWQKPGRVFSAEFDHIGDPLRLVLHGGLPTPQCLFFLGHEIVVLLDALGIVGTDGFHFSFDLGVLLESVRFEIFQLLLLTRFVGIEGLSAPQVRRRRKYRLHRAPSTPRRV